MSPEPVSEPAHRLRWCGAALLAAAALVLGSLYLSLGLGLKACPLCLYERSFAMAVAGTLGMGVLLSPGDRPRGLALLALPPAAAGLAVTVFHVYLELSGVLVCPAGVLGIGRAPEQSLGGFAVLNGLLLAGALGPGWRRRLAPAGFGLALGVALAVGSVKAAPPLPPPHPTFGPDGKRVLSGCEPALLKGETALRPAAGGKGGQ